MKIFRMKNPVVIVCIGKTGSIFVRGFLRLGHPVYPVVRAINGDPEHGCTGRSAEARLERTRKLADEHGLDLSRLKQIASTL